MRSTDIEAIGALVAEAAAGTGGAVEQTHSAISARVFGAIGPGAEPVRRIHDGISRGVYRAVNGGLRGAATHGTRVWARNQPRDYTPLDASPAGLVAIGAINGIWGDFLVETGNALAQPMTLRPIAGGDAIPATADGLAAAYPEATGRIAIFVHGLCETELAWNGLELRPSVRRAAKARAAANPERAILLGDATRPMPFGDRLRDDLDITPVYVRFNSGVRISDNGRALSDLIAEVVDAWPVHVDELILVGHSLGGLVARSACHVGADHEAQWTDRVRHVFCLGSPHLGADLEKGVHLLDWALGQFPETRGLGALLRRRSVGVKDLRFGAIAESDWHGHDPDELLRDRCQEVPFLPDAHYYFVSAQLTGGPVGRFLGDLLVRHPSASGVGRARQIGFEVDRGLQLSGLSHFDLLTHPDVYAQLRDWIERAGFAAAADVAAG